MSTWTIDRGELITHHPRRPLNGGDVGVSEAIPTLQGHSIGHLATGNPGLPGHLYVSGTDEHDEDGVLLSDVYTDTVRRKKMVDKRARKMSTVAGSLARPEIGRAGQRPK